MKKKLIYTDNNGNIITINYIHGYISRDHNGYYIKLATERDSNYNPKYTDKIYLDEIDTDEDIVSML